MKITKGDRVLVAPCNTRYDNGDYSWGVRVFDPDAAEEHRQYDISIGNALDDAGESRLYSDARVYDVVRDGDDLITVEEVRGKASYQRVRGVYYAPASLVKGRTPSGRPCWFRTHDVVAVVAPDDVTSVPG